MSDYNFAYIGMGAAFLMIALGAMAFGVWGIYTIATGGTGEVESTGADIEAFECSDEAFSGDPEFPGDPDHETDREILSATEVASVNESVDDGTYVFEITMEGTLLDAWATYEDGAELPVTVTDDRATVETQSDDPYRLWIDNAADGITRTELTICPDSF